MTRSGTSKFSYRNCPGNFYPVSMLMRARLTYHVPEFDYGEVNPTFYACTAAHRQAMLD